MVRREETKRKKETNTYHLGGSVWFGQSVVDGPSTNSFQNNDLMKKMVPSHNVGYAAVNTCTYKNGVRFSCIIH